MLKKRIYEYLKSIHYSLFNIHFSPLTFHHSLFTIHFSPFTFHHSLFTTHFSPFTFHHSLFTTHFSPFTFHYSLFTTHFSPFTFHHSLFTTHFSSSFLITFLATSILNFLPFIFSSLMACNKSFTLLNFTAAKEIKSFTSINPKSPFSNFPF